MLAVVRYTAVSTSALVAVVLLYATVQQWAANDVRAVRISHSSSRRTLSRKGSPMGEIHVICLAVLLDFVFVVVVGAIIEDMLG
jgi:hypothetical protein